MSVSTTLPEGKRAVPGLLCGVAAGLLTAGIWLLELIQPLDRILQELYRGMAFPLDYDYICSGHIILASSVLFSFVVAYVILDCDGVARQLIIVCFLAILLLGSSLLTILWGCYFSPFLPLIAVTSSALFAIFYACQHDMPCAKHLRESKASEMEYIESGQNEDNIVEKVMIPFSTIASSVDKTDGQN